MIRWDADPSAGPQCSRGTCAAMHQGSKKSACRNTPPVKCATRKTSDNASMHPFYQDQVFRSCFLASRSQTSGTLALRLLDVATLRHARACHRFPEEAKDRVVEAAS